MSLAGMLQAGPTTVTEQLGTASVRCKLLKTAWGRRTATVPALAYCVRSTVVVGLNAVLPLQYAIASMH